MLNIKRKLSQKGFSLIELMVAVVILAMAIFGIFQAYSVGFMGMADARAVTVATNYAREAMEDIKNMDFDKIPTSESSSVTVNGITYNRQLIAIIQEDQNIKKVVTTVTWKDRNGNTKTVETDMVVHFIETTAGDATRIMLYADPYNVLVLDLDDYNDGNEYKYSSIITAVIKDAKGNTIIDWDKEVIFSLTGSGTLSSATIPTGNPITIPTNDFVNNKAIITFTSSDVTEEVTVTASTEGLTSDSVTINVYNEDKPVKINLANWVEEEKKLFMIPGTSSIVTATIVNAGGETVEVNNEIIFEVSGPGSFSTPSPVAVNASSGVASIDLTSNNPPGGRITVTATASIDTRVISGVIDIITGGQIILSASPIVVPNGEQSVITVTTKDVNDVPINYVGTINLSVEGIDFGSGTLSDYTITFDGLTPSKEVTFTATSDVGAVNITATDSDPILTDSDILTLTLKERLTPHHIIVYAIPLSIPAGGAETLITAKVMTEDNVKIISYTNDITFTTTAGTFSGGATLITSAFVDGIATVSLYSSNDAETAEITVSSTVSGEHIITGSTEVGFYIGPDHIELTADPQNILVSGQNCTVTAKIVDYTGTMISSYNGDIYFSISPCPDTIKYLEATTSFLTQKIKKGITTVKLISGDYPGTAVIYAFSENLFGSLNIPVGISSLTLVEGSIDYPEANTVRFDINIIGASLTLEQMQVSWDFPSGETLNKIIIYPAGLSGEEMIIFDTDIALLVGSVTYSDEPIVDPNIRIADIEIASDTTLSAGTYTIVMYFSTDMSVKNILDVTFNPNPEGYTVNLIP